MELSLFLRTLCNICCIAFVAGRGTKIYVPLDNKIGQDSGGTVQRVQTGGSLRPPSITPGSRTHYFPSGQRPIVGQQRPRVVPRPVVQRPVLTRPQVTTHRMPTNPVRTRPSASIPSRTQTQLHVPGRGTIHSRTPSGTSPIGKFPSRTQANARPTIPRRTPVRTPVRTPSRTPSREPSRNPYISRTQLYSQSRTHTTQQVLTSRHLHVQHGALPKTRTNGVCRYHGYYPIACCTGWKRVVNPTKPWTYSCKRKYKHCPYSLSF
ncbi:putative uncharacterized protein DDB_G0290521 [Lytechinus variegatus]|uniref:putative uncharacterized protein DDB_G0290521 n=1 Tax=Lytechinus variegatus TaxID=7654 RepID=UPI001BB144FB|nr:putative uncharacterized protein DDB_G0290521 [Lytechinus variegatus]